MAKVITNKGSFTIGKMYCVKYVTYFSTIKAEYWPQHQYDIQYVSLYIIVSPQKLRQHFLFQLESCNHLGKAISVTEGITKRFLKRPDQHTGRQTGEQTAHTKPRAAKLYEYICGKQTRRLNQYLITEK